LTSTTRNIMVSIVVLLLGAVVCLAVTALAGLKVYYDSLATASTGTLARALPLGELATMQSQRAPASFVSNGKGVSIGAMEYIVSDGCPVGDHEGSESTKFIAVRLRAENQNPEVVRVFPQELSLQRNGETVAVTWEHLSEEGEHCHGDWLDVSFLRELQPGESCEGWEIFEVTQDTSPEELVVVATWGDPVAFKASWRLGP
jgi:hypothetical protein